MRPWLIYLLVPFVALGLWAAVCLLFSLEVPPEVPIKRIVL